MGNTCVHLAAEQGSRRILTYLIYHNAIINCRNKAGLFPETVAVNAGHQDIADFLHGITSPPGIIENVATYKTKNREEAEIHWSLPSQPNYYPLIDVVEVQLKQNKFFDSWKTVETVRSSTRGPLPEDVEKQLITSIQFDRKCGSAHAMDATVVELASANPEVFKKRALPEKNWVAPPCQCLIELPSTQQYVIRLRCGNKYGMGDYTNAVNVELNSFAKGQAKKTKVEEIKFEQLPPSDDSDSSDDSDDSDSSNSSNSSDSSDSSDSSNNSNSSDSSEKKEKKKPKQSKVDSSDSSDSSEEERKRKKKQKGKHEKKGKKDRTKKDKQKGESKAKVKSEPKVKQEERAVSESSDKPTKNPPEDPDSIIREIMNGGVDVLIQKVEQQIDIRSLKNQNGLNLLMVASSNGKEDLVKWILQSKQLDINAVNAVVICTLIPCRKERLLYISPSSIIIFPLYKPSWKLELTFL